MLRTAILTAALFCLPLAAYAAPEIGRPAPDFTGTSADGSSVTLSTYKGKIVVLEWHNPYCPFVKKHYGSNNMQSLQTAAHEDGVVWLTINSGAPGKQGSMNAAEASEHVKTSGLRVTHYLIDPEGKIGKLYGAKSTPHMFVIDAKGNVAYMGAIDNKPTANQADIEAATNYVADALESLQDGKPVAVASTQSYGCSVKY